MRKQRTTRFVVFEFKIVCLVPSVDDSLVYLSLSGLGIALKIYPESPGKQGYPSKLCCLILSLISSQLTEIYKIPQNPVGLFYVLSFLKWAMLIVVIVLVIPKFCNIFFKNNANKKNHKS